MRREVELDRLNGFVGKTVIHPSQIPVVNASMQIPRDEYMDACQILQWIDSTKGVEKGTFSGRMNEVKCHTIATQQIIAHNHTNETTLCSPLNELLKILLK